MSGRSVDRKESGPSHALRVIMLPRDTNQYGTVFGGVILSFIDQAGFIEARKHGVHRWVTVAVDRVEFRAPIHVGDVVSFLTKTVRTGRTSVTVQVMVEAERFATAECLPVTEAQLVMVAVNERGEAIPFASAPTAGINT